MRMAANKSLGMKALLVCLLSLLMTIPALFFFALLGDRTGRAQTVYDEIGQIRGGAQVFSGPILAVPYTLKPQPNMPAQQGVYYLFAETGTTTAKVRTETLQRSIFKVPVYVADVAYGAQFDLSRFAVARKDMVMAWDQAELLVGAQDLRGARRVGDVIVNGQARPLRPASGSQGGIVMPMARGGGPEMAVASSPAPIGRQDYMAPWALMAAPVGDLVAAGRATLKVSAEMTFTGAHTARFTPFAKDSQITVTGDWPDPAFKGAFLPEQRRVQADGFSASWRVPFVARGLADAEAGEGLNKLANTAFEVDFVRTDDPYQSVGRALKYALLFLGLVFLAFFLFEAMMKKRVHAAQYVLIGLAQLVFYLLLLSIAEHLGFDRAFLLAAVATVGLIATYAGWTFDSRKAGLMALALFGALYGLIYILMRLEDYALLVGSVVSFAAIAVAMLITRRIDWYGDSEKA